MAVDPQTKALQAVTKRVLALRAAQAKSEVLNDKAEAASKTADRLNRQLVHAASHPDLPDGFDLAEFAATVETPAKEPRKPRKPKGEVQSDEVGEPEDDSYVDDDEVSATEPDGESALKDFAEVDADPFADDAPVPAPKRRRRVEN